MGPRLRRRLLPAHMAYRPRLGHMARRPLLALTVSLLQLLDHTACPLHPDHMVLHQQLLNLMVPRPRCLDLMALPLPLGLLVHTAPLLLQRQPDHMVLSQHSARTHLPRPVPSRRVSSMVPRRLRMVLKEGMVPRVSKEDILRLDNKDHMARRANKAGTKLNNPVSARRWSPSLLRLLQSMANLPLHPRRFSQRPNDATSPAGMMRRTSRSHNVVRQHLLVPPPPLLPRHSRIQVCLRRRLHMGTSRSCRLRPGDLARRSAQCRLRDTARRGVCRRSPEDRGRLELGAYRHRLDRRVEPTPRRRHTSLVRSHPRPRQAVRMHLHLRLVLLVGRTLPRLVSRVLRHRPLLVERMLLRLDSSTRHHRQRLEDMARIGRHRVDRRHRRLEGPEPRGLARQLRLPRKLRPRHRNIRLVTESIYPSPTG